MGTIGCAPVAHMPQYSGASGFFQPSHSPRLRPPQSMQCPGGCSAACCQTWTRSLPLDRLATASP